MIWYCFQKVPEFFNQFLSFFNKNKNILKIVIFVILCSIILWIVIDANFLHPLPRPLAVQFSNITKTETTITYVTSKRTVLCAILFSFWLPDMKIYCDPQPTTLHRYGAKGLRHNSTYRTILGYGAAWFTKFTDPVGNKLIDPSFVTKVIPSFKTLSKSIEIDLNNALIIYGQVTNAKALPQAKATIILSVSSKKELWSAQANVLGRFALVLPPAEPIDEIFMTAWSTEGMIITRAPLEQVIGSPMKLTVEKYE